jgi:hypothetical protein
MGGYGGLQVALSALVDSVTFTLGIFIRSLYFFP